MASVVLDHITKTYNSGKITAVDDFSLSVGKGELFGLIGPDGAGKTSIFRILTTLLLPDKGTASVEGFDVVKDFKAIRGCVGYMPGRFSLYQDLTVEENLNFFATVFGTTIQENYELIKEIYVQIEPFKHRRAGKLSGGMKQKLALSCALIHKPKVLFLDEPTTGVDAVSRKEFWEMLGRLKQQGITIMVSTPYMDEASLCDRIALMQDGKILSLDTPSNVTKAYPTTLYAMKDHHLYPLQNSILAYEQTRSCYSFGEYLHVTLKKDSEVGMAQLMSYLKEKGYGAVETKKIEPEIEDCFIRLITEQA
ncbi:MAG: ABC transporter ATP-binding protein [Bacteroidetes bacterium]|nr:ABC transporter ATP-binding protein [Bacteroidota bacterium]